MRRSVTVLYVEDDEIDQMAMKRFFKTLKKGYKLIIAGSVSETEQLLRTETIDVIISDFKLGDGTAFDVLEVSAGIPVIITTGAGDEETAVEAMKSGASDYFTKDLNRKYYKRLPPAISKIIRENDLRREKECAELALQESEQRFKSMFAHMSAGVVIYEVVDDGKDFIIREFNDSAQKIDGISRIAVVGKRVTEAFPGVEEFGLLAVLRQVYKDGRPVHYPTEYYKDDRVEGWRENDVFKLPTGEVVAVYQDVTERKRAELALFESEERYRDIFENANDLIQSVDPEGKFIYVNSKWMRTLGYDEEEVKELNVFDIIHPKELEHYQQIFAKISQGENIDSVSTVFVSKSGHRVFVDGNVSPRMDNGVFLGTRAIFRDVTSKHFAEVQLQESEAKFRSFFENEPDYCYMISSTGTILDMNPAAAKVLGVEKKDIIGKPFFKTIYTEEGVEKAKGLLDEWRSREKISNQEISMKAQGGQEKIVLLSAEAVKNIYGEIIYSICIHRDVTEIKVAEAEMKEWRSRYEAAIQSSGHVLYDWDVTTDQVTYGGNSMQVLGYTLDELSGDLNKWFDLIHPDDRGQFEKDIRELVETQESAHMEYRVKCKDGRYITVEYEGNFIDTDKGVTRMIGFVKDITERKRFQDEIEEREEKYRSLVETLHEGLGIVDLHEDIVFVNSAFSDLLGYTEEELIGKNLGDLVVPEEFGNVQQQRVSRSEGESSEYEISMYRKDGEARLFKVYATPWFTKGEFGGTIGLMLDITDQREAQIRLQESEDRFKHLFEYAPDAYYMNDFDGNFRDGNWAAEELLMRKKEDLIGKNFLQLDLIHPDDLELAGQLLLKNIQGDPTGPDELRLKRADDTYVPTEVRTMPVDIGGETVVLGIARDITDRKEAEAERERFLHKLEEANRELRRADKLKDQFLSITSHELRNPLAAIMSILDVIKRGLYDDEKELMDFINTSYNTSEQMLTILNDLLDLTKIEAGKMEIVIDEVEMIGPFDDIYLLYGSEISSDNLEFKVEHPPEGMLVRADQKRVKQVLTNLVSNARKFTDEGSITLKADMDTSPGYMTIIVKDTGIGVSLEDQEQLFQPFSQIYRRREKKVKGTGLGLAICRSLIEAMGGKIWIESEGESKGSTVSFTLPLAKEIGTGKQGPTYELCEGGDDDEH